MEARSDVPPGYPSHWEADVLLSDGRVAHLRPIRPSDAGLLTDFYARVSDESKFLRFFAPYPVLSERDVRRFTTVDYTDRVALILTVADQMIAVARYDRLDHTDALDHDRSRRAEVAFLVEDAHQGRGAAQLLLEHLAEAARERGITGFVAEVLPQNQAMAQVFADAGYRVTRALADGVVEVEFPILPTDTSVGVMERREHRAESSSVARLLSPRQLAVVGPGERVQGLVSSLLSAGFRGTVTAVSTDGVVVHGVPTAGSVDDIGGGLDLVLAALPPHRLGSVVIEAAHRGAQGLVALTGSGSAAQTPTTDPAATDPAAEAGMLVSLVRSYGLRALGPEALGLINTDPEVGLNASPGPMPREGSVALFCQSPAVGVAMLSWARDANLGISHFISSGAYADVTGNDVLQFWEDDERTRVGLLSADRIGNPRKFTRIMRRLTARKPVIVYAPGQAERISHLGDRGGLHRAPTAAVDAMFRQSGVIVVHQRKLMFDIARILARQPLPAGPRVGVVTNSVPLVGQMGRTMAGVGLVPGGEARIVGPDAPARDVLTAARAALADPACDTVVVAVVNPFGAVLQELRDELQELAATTTKPLIAVIIEFGQSRRSGRPDGPGRLPVFRSQGDALTSLAAVSAYAHWRSRDKGAVPMLEVDQAAARAVVNRVLAVQPDGRRLTDEEATELLRAFGITMVPAYPVTGVDEAIAVGERLGWNVVLKATADGVRSRPDLAGVFRYIDDAEEMRRAWHDLGEVVAGLADPQGPTGALAPGVDPAVTARPVVQAMMGSGVALVVESREDPAFGPVLSLGLDGIASQLLGDVSYRVPPLTTTDAAAMVRDLKAAPLLFGWQGSQAVDVAAVELLLHRVAQLADALPQLAVLRLGPCLATASGVRVLGARVEIAPTAYQRDPTARALS